MVWARRLPGQGPKTQRPGGLVVRGGGYQARPRHACRYNPRGCGAGRWHAERSTSQTAHSAASFNSGRRSHIMPLRRAAEGMGVLSPEEARKCTYCPLRKSPKKRTTMVLRLPCIGPWNSHAKQQRLCVLDSGRARCQSSPVCSLRGRSRCTLSNESQHTKKFADPDLPWLGNCRDWPRQSTEKSH